jgi:hypothetical protein
MSKRIDEAMAKIKLYQEECKLVMMIIASITSVAVFITKFLEGGFKAGVKVLEVAGSGMGGGGMAESRMPMMVEESSSPINWVLWISGLLALTFVPVAVILLVRRIRWWKGGTKPDENRSH